VINDAKNVQTTANKLEMDACDQAGPQNGLAWAWQER